jgi:3-oxoacyl-[acyl-carrier protein] reductase
MLKNKIIAISGGAGRLGSSFAKKILNNNGKVILADINLEKGKRLESKLGKKNAIFFNGDLTDPNSIEKFIDIGLKHFGKIDAAIHCAYPVSNQWGESFENLKPEGLKEDLFNQLGGAILFSQNFIKYFRKQGYGNLIHISSIQGVSAPKFDHYVGTKIISPLEYSAIKAGIISITKYLAKYCKNERIRVNCISPGGILDNQPEIFLEKYKSSCNSKGMLDAEDLSSTILFLLLDESKYVTGQNIIVDDGWTL